MGHAEPTQDSVGIFVVRINKSGESVDGLWKAKIEARDSPHQDNEKAPEPQCTMQVPGEPRKKGSPVHGQSATPIANSGPPYDGASQTQQNQTNRADAVQETALRSEQ